MTKNKKRPQQPAEPMENDRLNALEEENELLLLQLHQIQEELERYFLKYQALQKNQGNVSGSVARPDGWMDDELPEALAEVARLLMLVETQTRLRRIEATNSLNARLGDILIQSVSPSGSLVGLPTKLLKIWRAATAQQPPTLLGGNNFDKAIEAYHEGGIEAVHALLSKVLAPEIKAKAYTTLARHLMKKRLYAEAAGLARRAYEEDPQPYRLKWLAFRLHEAGEIIEADATLSLLPQDIPFSNSESRQREQVRYEAKNARLREAKQKIGFESRCNAIEQQMKALRQGRDKQAGMAAERQVEIEALKMTQAQLRQEKTLLEAEHSREISELKSANALLEQEKAGLAARYAEQTKLVEEQQSRFEQLSQDKMSAEVTYIREVEALKLAKEQLEQEKTELAVRHQKQAKLALERQTQLEHLHQANATTETTNHTKITSLQKQADGYSKKIESLKNKIAQTEKEKGSLGEMIHDLVPFFYGRRLTYVDIGAYVGDVFLDFANSELKIREAHLVEPNSQNYNNLIDRTSRLLKNGELHHYCLAVDKEPGKVILLPGGAMTRTVPLCNDDFIAQEEDNAILCSTTLDLLIDRVTESHIDLLKIDVEGYEENVLFGAQSVFHRQLVDVVIIEVGMNPEGKQQCYYRKIDDFMMEAGYRIFRIYDQMYEWMSDAPFMRRANFVYMSEKFARSSPYRLTHELYRKEKIIEELKMQIQSRVAHD